MKKKIEILKKELNKFHFILIVVIILIGVLGVFPEQVGAETWNIQTIDTAGDVGSDVSLAIDNNDNPHISYYNSTNADLKYAKWNGISWSNEIVDSTGNVGRFTSITTDSNNLPYISYYDSTNADLKYAIRNDNWRTAVVDSSDQTGQYSSISIDSKNNPHICYQNISSSNLRYAKWNESTWNFEDVDSDGAYTSMVLDSNNNPHISYLNTSSMNLRYAKWNGSAWIKMTVDASSGVGYSTSIAIDSNDTPHISYYDLTNGDLKYAKWNGGSWSNETVDSTGNVGWDASIAIDSNDNPHISYYDVTNLDLKYAKGTVNGWSITTVDSDGDVGMDNSLALGFYDNPMIAYYDNTNLDLKFAFVNATPLPVQAWGYNNKGQLGNGQISPKFTPAGVKGLLSMKAITAGVYHSAGLKSDGTVWTWGGNNYGQLGSGTSDTDPHPIPAQVGNIAGVKTISSFGDHIITLKNDGTVWTWGRNNHGQLGTGTSDTDPHPNPAQVSNLTGVRAITTGLFHTSALKSDGTVWTWGSNSNGQLGNSTIPFGADTFIPAQTTGISNVRGITSGLYHTIALKNDKTVWTWGSNSDGQLGNGSIPIGDNSSMAVKGDGLSNIESIASGYYHTIALKSDGTVWTWGHNSYGQLGNGTSDANPHPIPAQVTGLSNVIAIGAGAYHSIAIENDGTVWTWGYNSYGQLGTDTSDQSPHPIPAKVIGLSGMSAVAGGSEHTLAMKDTVPPGSIDNLKNESYAPIYINWTWTDPDDEDLANVSIWINGTFETNVSKGSQFYNSTGLQPNRQYTIDTRTVDTSGNINETVRSWTARTEDFKISGVPVTVPTTNSADISWTTNLPSDSFVKYGVNVDEKNLTMNKSDPSKVSSHRITLTELSASTKYYYKVNSTDQVGNEVMSNVLNFTTIVQTDSGSKFSSGGGGGGGGGGGPSGENYSNILLKEKYEDAIFKDKITSYRFRNATNPVTFINITGSINAGLIETAVEVLKGTSTLVKEVAPGIVYKNFNIWVGTSGFGTSKNIQSGAIGFRIENSWLDTNGFSGSDIRIVKWDGSKWIELDTKDKSKDASFHYFEAATNSFSPFAITCVKSAALPQRMTWPEMPSIAATSAPSQPQPPKEPANWQMILAVFAILMLAGFILYLWTKRSLKIILAQTTVFADGISTLPVKVQFVNGFGQIVKYPHDKEVRIVAVSGRIENTVIPADKGFAEATLTSSNECGPVTITAISDKTKATAQVIFKAKETGVCIHCGKEVREGEKFCESCGKPME